LVVQSSSGLLSITGTSEGESVRCGYGVTDVTAGLFSVIGILLALRAREQTGRGQYVDVAMLDCMISTMSSNYMSYLGSGNVPEPMGTAFPTVVPYRAFHTADRSVAIAVGSEKLWAAFCRAIERPEIEKLPEYASNALRIQNRVTLESLLASVFLEKTASDWLERLQAAGIPSSLVRNFDEVARDPQCELREMFPLMEHAVAGPHRVTGIPVKLSETPGGLGLPAPLQGEHTRDVMMEFFGLDNDALADLEARGVLRSGA
jgi:crotonobetainyl-CoA:carnitine CoA-transferase CaiB-like acyl-CoA transferase